MGKSILIDGYNLLHQMPEIRSEMDQNPDGARSRFLHRLSAYAQTVHASLTVVFDGAQSPHAKFPRIKISFSKNETADAVIKRMVDKPHRVQKPLVISSDLEIVNFARQCGAKTLSSQEFVKEITAFKPKKMKYEKKYEAPMSSKEVKEWMDLFQRKADDE